MRRIVLTDGELEFLTDSRERFFLSYEDYPELATLYEQAVEVVSNYRTPEQIRADEITEFAIMADPEGALDVIPDWEEWTEYRVGEHVVYEGVIYRIVQTHRSQHDWLPPNLPALYTIANKSTVDPVDPEDPEDPDEGYPDWVRPTGAHDAYNMGDKVMFEGEAYESIMNGNTWNPTESPESWRIVE